MAVIRINRPCDVVWRIFTDPNSWEIWWGGTLKRVNPGWQSEAILEWKGGDRSTVFDFVPLKRVGVRGSYGEIITWSFTTDGPEATFVVMEADLSMSTLRETSPGALEIEFQSALSEFKKYAESTPKFRRKKRSHP
jgi:uncharacterized protein YndB with AHSA1/START domain